MYYRLLHGPYGESNGALNKAAKWMCPRISLAYHCQREKRWEVGNLRDVRHNVNFNPQREYMKQKAGNIFRCEIEFTPPQAETDAPGAATSVWRAWRCSTTPRSGSATHTRT